MDELKSLTVSVGDAAVLLGISRTSAYECVRSGELRAIRLGRRLVVPRVAIDELLAGTTPNTAPASSSDTAITPLWVES